MLKNNFIKFHPNLPEVNGLNKQSSIEVKILGRSDMSGLYHYLHNAECVANQLSEDIHMCFHSDKLF